VRRRGRLLTQCLQEFHLLLHRLIIHSLHLVCKVAAKLVEPLSIPVGHDQRHGLALVLAALVGEQPVVDASRCVGPIVEVSRPRPEFTSVPGQRDRLPDAVVCVRPGLVGNVDGDAFGVLATVPLRPRGDQVEIGVRARLP